MNSHMRSSLTIEKNVFCHSVYVFSENATHALVYCLVKFDGPILRKGFPAIGRIFIQFCSFLEEKKTTNK